MRWRKWMNDWIELIWVALNWTELHEWVNEWTNERNRTKWNEMKLVKWIDEWTNERTNEWSNESMNQWIIFQWCSETPRFLTFSSGNQALATVSYTFCRPHLPKVLGTRQFFSIFKWTCSSRYTLVHLLPTSIIFQKCSEPDSLLTSPSGNVALASVLRAFCRPRLPKALRDREFLYEFYMKSSSRYSPVHFLSTTFPDRAAQPLKQRPSFVAATLSEKIWFGARERFQAWIHAFPISHTSQLLIYMVMWLPWWLRWWWGCHHGDRASHDNRS